MARHRSSTAPLALAYAALIVYASLYPLDDWRVPTDATSWRWLLLPWPHWFPTFDVVANLLGYLPFGALLYLAAVRSGASARSGALLAVLSASGLSYAMEATQSFVPSRVPSLADWLLNTLGAASGLLLAALLQRAGAIAHWQALRERWVIAHSAGALTLLLLWPLGLLFPAPVPLGTGQIMPWLRETLVEVALDTPVSATVDEWAQAGEDVAAGLTPPAEGAAVMLGLLAPCLLAFSVVRSRGRRVAAACVVAAVGFAATTLSTALNFGPQHALAWLTPVTPVALALGLALACALALVPRRAAAGLGLMALTLLVVLVAQAPADPYFASSLQDWEQGRFIRFHGLARWLGWLWPYVALLVLLWRVAASDDARP